MKDNKKTIIVLIVLAIGLLFCASIFIYKNNINKHQDVINIDDCSGIDCDKKKEDKSNKDTDNKDNKDNNNNNNNNNNTDNNNNNNQPGGNGNGNGSGGDSGNGSGNGNGSGSGGGSGNGQGTAPSDDEAKEVVVSDDNTTWQNNTQLKVFNVDKIKPGDNGSYRFAVNNNTGGNIVYSIDFNEDNQYSANILYKLKMNDKYIKGDSTTWVSYDELDLTNKVLNADYMDSFMLEWKWVDSDHDTGAGVVKGSTYTLGVSITSKETTDKDTSGSGSVNPRTEDNITMYVIIFIESLIVLVILVILKRNKDEKVW